MPEYFKDQPKEHFIKRNPGLIPISLVSGVGGFFLHLHLTVLKPLSAVTYLSLLCPGMVFLVLFFLVKAFSPQLALPKYFIFGFFLSYIPLALFYFLMMLSMQNPGW